MERRITGWIRRLLVLSFVATMAIGLSMAAPSAPRGVGEYTALRLAKLPTQVERQQLEASGIKLYSWLEGTTFWAYVPVDAIESLRETASGRALLGAKTRGGLLAPVAAARKFAPHFWEHGTPSWAVVSPGVARVQLWYLEGVEAAAVVSNVEQLGGRFLEGMESLRWLLVEMPVSHLRELAALPYIQGVAWQHIPEELEDVNQRNLTGVATLSERANGGLGLEGRGMNVAIFDGNMRPHKDFGNRLHVIQAKDPSPSMHGMHCGGIIAGSGLLDPRAKGMAPEANLYAWNFKGSVPPLLLRGIKKYKTYLSSNSYGAGFGNPLIIGDRNSRCNDKEANLQYNDEQVDRLSYNEPKLCQVFSNGNYQDDCAGTSGDQQGYFTTTRTAKNVITVGAVDSVGKMSYFSSWGPLIDGRLAPLVCSDGVKVWSTFYGNAYGYMSGTSQACPSVTGLMTLLYEHYRNLNNSELPNFVLMKSVLLNTCLDKGKPGPDYSFGYGIVNGPAAASVLSRRNYHEGKVSQGKDVSFKVTVPAGQDMARFMLVWNDEGGVGDQRDLINDLDMEVVGPDGQHLPWLLNPKAPSAEAVRGVDRLNNHEQVEIATPKAGEYTVQVKGTTVPSEEVPFAVSWYFVGQGLEMLFPNGGERLSQGAEYVVRWDARKQKGKGKLSISIDGGGTFTLLKDIPSVETGWTRVRIPKNLANSDRVRLRISNAVTFDDSDADLRVGGMVSGFKFVSDECKRSGTFSWDAVAGATEYQLLVMKPSEKEAKLHKTVNGTTYRVDNVPLGDHSRYAVQAVMAGGETGPSSVFLEPIVQTSIDLSKLPVVVSLADEEGRLTRQHGEDVTTVLKEGIYLVKGKWNNGADFFKKTATPFKDNPSFVATAEMCVDAKAMSGKMKFQLQTMCKGEVAAGSRLMLVEGTNQTVLRDSENRESVSIADGNTQRYFDLSSMAGKSFKLRVESYAARGGMKGFDLAMYTDGKFMGDAVDVAIGHLKLPYPGKLTAKEKVSVVLYNNGLTEAQVAVSMMLDGKKSQEKTYKLKAMDVGVVQFDNVNLSLPDHAYNVEVKVTATGSEQDLTNNTVSGVAYNLGDYYLLPVKKSIVDKAPIKKLSPGETLRFADRGGRLLGYDKDSVCVARFSPEEKGARVKIHFSEIKLANANDELVISNISKYGYPETYVVFDGTKEYKDITVIGDSGDLEVEFHPNGEVSGDGWYGTVTTTTDKNETGFTNNTLIVKSVSLKDDDAQVVASELSTVQVAVENTTDKPFDKMLLRLFVDGRMIEDEVVGDVKPGRSIQSFKKPVDLRRNPMTYKLKVEAIVQSDMVLRDNSAEVTVKSDRYVLTKGSAPNRPQLGITNVQINGKTFPGIVDTDTYPHYFRSSVLPVYQTAGGNEMTVQVFNEVGKEMHLLAWIDWNEDGKFSAEEAVRAVSAGSTTGAVRLNLPTDKVVNAARVMRLILSMNPKFDVNQRYETNYKVLSSIYDYSVLLLAQDPNQVDAAIASMKVKGTGATTEVTAVVQQNGITTLSNVTVKLIDIYNGQEKELGSQVVATLAPQATANVDFGVVNVEGAGDHTLRVVVNVAEDFVPANDMLEKRVFTPPTTPPGEYVIATNGSMGRIQVEGWNNDLTTATYMAWVNPELYSSAEGSYAYIFSGKGVGIYISPFTSMSTHYNEGCLVVHAGSEIYYTESSSKLPLNQWSHIALTNQKGKAPTLYINGEKTTLHKRTGNMPVLAYAKGAALYIGNKPEGDQGLLAQIDEVRVYADLKTEAEVKAAMYEAAAQDQNTLLALSFNEGRYWKQLLYKNPAANSELSVEFLQMDVDSEKNGAWVKGPYPTFVSLKIDGEVQSYTKWARTETAPGEFVFTNETSKDKSNLTLDYQANIPGVTMTINSTLNMEAKGKVSGMNFTVEQQVPMEVKWGGKTIKSTNTLKLTGMMSKDCMLTELKATQPFSADGTIEGGKVVLIAPSGTGEVKEITLTYKVSSGATVLVDGEAFSSGSKLDCSVPRVLRVLAENQHDYKEYALSVLHAAGTISWDQDLGTVTYGSEPIELSAALDGRVLYYTSSNEKVAVVRGELLTIAGQGEADITVHTKAQVGQQDATAITKHIKVEKAKLVISAENKEVDMSDLLPEYTLKYESFVNGEDASVLLTPATIACDAKNTDEAKTYSITVSGATAANYDISFKEGTLTVKQVVVAPLTFNVTFEGQPLGDAEITLAGRTIKTESATGQAKITLKVGTYKYKVTAAGKEPAEGTVTIDKADAQTIDVPMIKTLPVYTLSYTTDGNGRIEGEATQGVKKGRSGSKVIAVANKGYDFVKWTPGDLTTAERTDSDVQGDAEYTANFTRKTFTLKYYADANSTLQGDAEQKVLFEEDGKAVTAVASSGYSFVRWSDGVIDNPRTDKKVEKDIDVTAVCVKAASLPFKENFNATNSLPEGWSEGILPNTEHVQIAPSFGYFGKLEPQDGNAAIIGFRYGGQKVAADSWLATPVIRIEGYKSARLKFRYLLDGTSLECEVSYDGKPFVKLLQERYVGAPGKRPTKTFDEELAFKGASSVQIRWKVVNSYTSGFTFMLDDVSIDDAKYEGDPAYVYKVDGPGSIRKENGTLEKEIRVSYPKGQWKQTSITAVADAGFAFLGWSDGVAEATRTDDEPLEEITVKAIFGKDCSIGVKPTTVVEFSNDKLPECWESKPNPKDKKRWHVGSSTVDKFSDGHYLYFTEDVFSKDKGDVTVMTATYDLSQPGDLYMMFFTQGGGAPGKSWQYVIEYTTDKGATWNILPNPIPAYCPAKEIRIPLRGAVRTAATRFRFTLKYDGYVYWLIDNFQIAPKPCYSIVYRGQEDYVSGSFVQWGTIRGTNPQFLADGQKGTEVEAVAEAGFVFDHWDDGVETVKRTDVIRGRNIDVSAIFRRDNEDPQIFLVVKDVPNGFVGVRDVLSSEQIWSGTSLAKKQEIKIEPMADDGFKYKDGSISVTGATAKAGETDVYIVNDDARAVTVTAEFVVDPNAKDRRLVIEPAVNGTIIVSRGVETLNNDAKIFREDRLVIVADPDPNFKVKTLTVNGKAFESGATYEVKDADIKLTVKAEFEKQAAPKKRLLIIDPCEGGTVVVKRFNKSIASNTELQVGDKLDIRASASEGYEFVSLKVNGKDFRSGDKLDVTADMQGVKVTAVFRKIGGGGTPNAVADEARSITYSLSLNPVVRELRIDGLHEAVRVEVYSLTGTLVMSRELSADMTLDVSLLVRGAYILRVNGESLRFVKM